MASKKLGISEPAEFDRRFDSQDAHSLPVLENNANSQTGSHSMLMEAEENLEAGLENIKLRIPPLHSTELQASKSSEQIEQCSRREVDEPSSQISRHTISELEEKKITRFEAAAAEAELDMLLGSFSETSLPGSMPASLINKTSALKSSNFGFIDTGRSTSQDHDSSATDVPTSSIDDSIDDLLAETSLPLDDKQHRALPQQEASFRQNFPLGSISTNAYGFTSGQAMSESTADSIADSIDDLLAEASVSLEEQKHAENQQIKGTDSLSKGLPPRGASMSSKALDDFDSWLGTL